MAIQIGGTTVIDNSRNINAGIATFTRLDVPPIPITFSPAIGATNIVVSSNIIITFDQQVYKKTGNITLRSGSAGGTAFSTIAVSSGEVTISGGAVTINPSSNLPNSTNTFVVVDAGAFSGLTTTSVNNILNTYSFTTIDVEVGDSYQGGFLICKASPVRWVVSPRSAEVSRVWCAIGNANTLAQSCSGCTGWFVPSCGQLQNPGYCCRSFWGPAPCYSSTSYWSSTGDANGNQPRILDFSNGTVSGTYQSGALCVRSFRCVTY